MIRKNNIAGTLLFWGGGLFISAIFLDSLRFKFTGHPTPEHIFTTLKEWSGIALFFPAGPWIIGLGELAASILLIGLPLILHFTGKKALIGPSQFFGALAAFGIMSGAIIFHLFTPLGIETPVEWAAGSPTKYSPALFYSACVTWVLAVLIMIFRRASVTAWLRNSA
ncbi:hypothetical protein [Hyphococcus sp. DH-69]|uniref:hypothetical protein n=1 Tax=Hyphococcus formosus TaxID=3143534 RepID=UPI00398B1D33